MARASDRRPGCKTWRCTAHSSYGNLPNEFPLCRGNRSQLARLAAPNHPTGYPPHLRVMRYRVDAPITATEERAQYPTDQANQDRAPKSAPEAVDVKSMHEL